MERNDPSTKTPRKILDIPEVLFKNVNVCLMQSMTRALEESYIKPLYDDGKKVESPYKI